MPETLPLPGTFADKVQMLDAALTHKDAQTVAQTWRNQLAHHGTPDDWIFPRDAYYLSDGGYSRLAFSVENRRLFLTSNSTEAVFRSWQWCKELITDVESTIEEALTDRERKEGYSS